MTGKPLVSIREDAANVVAALERLHVDFIDRIAELRRNDVFLMFRNMTDAQFAAFIALNIPALMAWCARNALPAGTPLIVRNVHTQLAAQEALLTYFRNAASEVRKILATPAWEIRENDLARAQLVFARMHVFLEQLEKTGAFPPELCRATLFETVSGGT